MPRIQPHATTHDSSGGRLVATDGRTLPLKGVRLAGDASGGIARVVLEQRFANPFGDPLQVTYLLPLPADGAVSGFAFTIGDRRVVGEVDRRQRARERFERALVEGRTAGLVEQERSSLFTQELGNVPPGAEIVAELTIDQKLVWLDEGAWEWRFPTVVGPRYQGQPGRVADASRIRVDVADGELPVRAALALAIRDPLAEGARPESPSHRTTWKDGLVELLEEGGARLDRDVVVRWRAASAQVALGLDVGRPAADRPTSGAAYGLLTIVPPAPGAAELKARPRDVIVLLDTSGSMDGAPLDQAKRVVAQLIDGLGVEDRLEMIEFSSTARRWKTRAVAADERAKRDAHAWLRGLEAGGGTEMVSGVLEALAPLGPDGQRQVVLVTDGYIGFEAEVVKSIVDRLPAGSRLHVVGVGSAVNRSLTAPVARAGRGVEVVIGLDEDPERASRRLESRSRAPLVTDVELGGDAVESWAPARIPDLYAGAPALVAVRLRPEGGELVVRGKTAFGRWEERLRVAAIEPGAGPRAAAALYGREAVEDLELRRAAAGAGAGRNGEVDAAIERIGLDFQIATRLTTWIAISEEALVDPRSPTRKVTQPHELAYGLSVNGLGLRQAAPMAPMGAAAAGPATGVGLVLPEAEEAADDFGEDLDGLADERSVVPPPARAARPSPAAAPPAPPARGAPPAAPRAPEQKKTPAKQDLEKEVADKGESQLERKRRIRRVRGRIVIRRDRELVLVIELDAPLDWALPLGATALAADGSSTAARVVEATTTRPGLLGAMQSLRLGLELDEELAPEEIFLALPDGSHLILEVTA